MSEPVERRLAVWRLTSPVMAIAEVPFYYCHFRL